MSKLVYGFVVCFCLIAQTGRDERLLEIFKPGKYQVEGKKGVLISYKYPAFPGFHPELELFVDGVKVKDVQTVFFPNSEIDHQGILDLNTVKKSIVFRPKMIGKYCLQLKVVFNKKASTIGPFELHVK